MKIYTGTGDAGETGLYGGQRVAKNDARVEAYGAIDEANALLGVAACHLKEDTPLRELVTRLQGELFVLGADLATPLAREEQAGKSVVPRIAPEHTHALEQTIDEHEAGLEPLRKFILPGGSPAGAALHHARTVARRAERQTVALWHAAPNAVNPEALRYLNRFADLLFVLARVANKDAAVPDVPWIRPE